MPEQAVGNRVPTSARGAHGTNPRHVLDLKILSDLAVVPTLVIHVLTDQLNWWLCSVLFTHGQVEVVNEDNELAPNWRAIDALPPSVELREYQILGLVGGCLGRESEKNGHVRLLQIIHQLVVHD